MSQGNTCGARCRHLQGEVQVTACLSVRPSVRPSTVFFKEHCGKTSLCRDVDHPGKDMGALYAADVKEICDKLDADGKKPSCFIGESLQSCGGQVQICALSFLR
jgi:4-aminobutyrate aminotransferase-like enzyme